jgi:hypothetical protein
MNIDDDSALIESSDEEPEDEIPARADPQTGNFDARRMIERHLELKHLRGLLDNPDFDYNFD